MGADVGGLPPGFVLDQPVGGGLPSGFNVDPPQPSIWERAKQIAEHTPGGLLAKVAKKVLGGIDEFGDIAGGAVTDLGANVGLPAEASAGAGAVTKGVIQALPGVWTGAKVPLALEAAGRRVMQSALKPTSKALANGDAAKAITTMLEEGVSATPGGAAKIRTQIDKLKGEIGQLIAQSPATVDKGYVMGEVSKTLEQFRNQVNPTKDVKAIMDSWQEFNNLFAAKIPVQEAQAVKQGTQRVLRNSYGRTTVTPAEEATQKGMASGLREGIADAVPGVGERNAQASSLINLLNQLEPRTAMQANKDVFGLAALPLGESPEVSALMLADRNPWIKSLLARLLYSNRERIPAVAGGLGSEMTGVNKGSQ